jgi:adenosylcobinamide-GDP ribazoletransferase
LLLIKSFCIALTAYSVIPVPRFDWTEDNMRFSICFLPVIGVAIGILLFAWGLLCSWLNVGVGLFAAVAILIPLLLTGGIHMDGYCDVIDALSSHQDREKMLAILKDPHVGAFAIIYCGVYFIATFGVLTEIGYGSSLILICIGFVLSRAITSLLTILLHKARGDGFLVSFSADAHKIAVIASMLLVVLLAAAALILVNPIVGATALLAMAIFFLWYRFMTYRKFGGVTGDTSGFSIQMSELFLAVGALIGIWVERLIL